MGGRVGLMVTGRWNHLPPLPRRQPTIGMKRLLNDTAGTGVRVESGRQEPIGLINKNRQFPGFFVKKKLPVGGGWSDDVITFFVSFDSGVFPHGAEKMAK
jgi:hypothetical protein